MRLEGRIRRSFFVLLGFQHGCGGEKKVSDLRSSLHPNEEVEIQGGKSLFSQSLGLQRALVKPEKNQSSNMSFDVSNKLLFFKDMVPYRLFLTTPWKAPKRRQVEKSKLAEGKGEKSEDLRNTSQGVM